MSSSTPKSSPSATVAQNVATLRQRAGLTQQQLADTARISRATVHLIEAGHADPRLSTLSLVANALNVPLNHLIEDKSH